MSFEPFDRKQMFSNSERISELDRRNFLKIGLAIAGFFAGSSIASVVSAAQKVFPSGLAAQKHSYRPHYGMIIRIDRCIGCRLCEKGCMQTNAVPDYGWRTKVLEREAPLAIGQKREFIPVLCNHCNNPPCVRACPVRATYKDKVNGIVRMDYKKCIGCKICMVSCPYNARYFSEEKGSVDKCDFCFSSRLSKGEKNVACSVYCPADVRIFGDLSNPQDRVYKMVHQLQKPVWVLKKETDARPNIFYTKG